jgi:hypothetical protein
MNSPLLHKPTFNGPSSEQSIPYFTLRFSLPDSRFRPPTSATITPKIQAFTAKKPKLARNNPGKKLDMPRNSSR